ncbi:hypothetical protein [Amycolatopsis ultiminotia]
MTPRALSRFPDQLSRVGTQVVATGQATHIVLEYSPVYPLVLRFLAE